MKKTAVSNMGEEEVAQFKKTVLTREETKAEADVLFGDTAKAMRKEDRKKLEKLFVQMPAARTMAPNLQKESAAKNTLEFFEKLSSASMTDAQRRYPELLKVAATPTPDLKPRQTVPGKGPVPTRNMMTGGNS